MAGAAAVPADARHAGDAGPVDFDGLTGRASRRRAREPLITLGSAPLEVPGFRSVVLGQLGESRLVAAIDTDISGRAVPRQGARRRHQGPLRDIHRRVGTAILFESSGGQTDKVAHLPELRFALGEPEVDTTSIDNAAFALRRQVLLHPQAWARTASGSATSRR